ncbi:MAG: zinc finger protein [Gemmatimonadaceae bacterium]
MTAADAGAITALQELLDERQRYEGWLSVLDERRSSTPRHVYDRVHTDYSLRLERVTERLAERGDQLAGTIESLTSRLNALRAREAERTDARHEAELRAAVGEYGPEEWDRLRGTADRELGEIAEQRRGLEAEVLELQRILALTRNTPQISAGDQRSVLDSDQSVEQSGSDAGTSSDTQQGQAHAAGASGSEQDPPISDFVAEWPAKQGAGAENEAAPQGDGVPEVPEVDERSAARQATPVMQTTPAETQASAAAAISASASRASSNASPPRPIPPPMGDTRRESEKTLKCPECGVMNYATEWYCERCGGELSTF